MSEAIQLQNRAPVPLAGQASLHENDCFEQLCALIAGIWERICACLASLFQNTPAQPVHLTVANQKLAPPLVLGVLQYLSVTELAKARRTCQAMNVSVDAWLSKQNKLVFVHRTPPTPVGYLPGLFWPDSMGVNRPIDFIERQSKQQCHTVKQIRFLYVDSAGNAMHPVKCAALSDLCERLPPEKFPNLESLEGAGDIDCAAFIDRCQRLNYVECVENPTGAIAQLISRQGQNKTIPQFRTNITFHFESSVRDLLQIKTLQNLSFNCTLERPTLEMLVKHPSLEEVRMEFPGYLVEQFDTFRVMFASIVQIHQLKRLKVENIPSECALTGVLRPHTQKFEELSLSYASKGLIGLEAFATSAEQSYENLQTLELGNIDLSLEEIRRHDAAIMTVLQLKKLRVLKLTTASQHEQNARIKDLLQKYKNAVAPNLHFTFNGTIL